MSITVITIALIVICFIVINIYFRLADKFNIVDKPNHRSSHVHVTIRGGGIIFPLSALLGMSLMPDVNYMAMIGVLLLSLISFWDDIKSISTGIRFLAQTIGIGLLLYSGGINNVIFAIGLFPLFLGFLNGYNFMDGINGITGLYSLSIFISLLYVNIYVEPFINNDLFVYLIVPIVVFLFYNLRPKAKCFAGDIGSISIAYILAYLFLTIITVTHNPIYILFTIVYAIDILFTIFQRLRMGHNILEPHRMHLYQLLVNEVGIPHIKVSLLYAGLQLIVNICVLSVLKSNFQSIIILLLALLLVLSLSYVILKKRIIAVNK